MHKTVYQTFKIFFSNKRKRLDKIMGGLLYLNFLSKLIEIILTKAISLTLTSITFALKILALQKRNSSF